MRKFWSARWAVHLFPAVRLLSAKPGGLRGNGCWFSSSPFLPGKQAGLKTPFMPQPLSQLCWELKRVVAGGLADFSAWKGEGQVKTNVTPLKGGVYFYKQSLPCAVLR